MADDGRPGPTTDNAGEVGARLLRSSRDAPLEVSTSVDPSGAPLIEVQGEIDLSNSSVLESALASVTAGFPPRLVVDMSGVTFIDSTGLHALAKASQRVGEVCVRGAPGATRRVLEISGLVNLLSIES